MFPLLTASQLHTLLQNTSVPVIIVDCQHDLAAPEKGKQAYLQKHLPEARFAHVDETLSGSKNGHNGRHPLPPIDIFSAWLGQQGIDNQTVVVAYDNSGGMFAARLWWMLRWLGHQEVCVLNGGLNAWEKAGYPVVSGEAGAVKPATFVAKTDESQLVLVQHVEENLLHPSFQLLDARSNDRFHGQNETMDPIAGHIPGAKNRFFMHNLNEEGEFKSPEQLRDEFTAILGAFSPTEVVHSCGSGVTGCHNLLAFEVAGLHGARLYAGSWSEWIADPSHPVSR